MTLRDVLTTIIDIPQNSQFDKDNSIYSCENALEIEEWLNEHNYELVGISKEFVPNHHFFSSEDKLKCLIFKDLDKDSCYEYALMHINKYTHETLLNIMCGLSMPEAMKISYKIFEE